MILIQNFKSARRGPPLPLSLAAGDGLSPPRNALPDAPLGVRARTSRAPALEAPSAEALSVRATSWGAHSGVQTLRSVARSSLSLALLSALREQHNLGTVR